MFTPYDKVAYPTLSHEQTHPDRFATLATLLGIEPPSVETARVLDVGCGTGGNILPMACSLPKAHFTGIDLSERQIVVARAHAAELGLANVAFLAADIMEIDALGTFDYIIVHGMYSWVPRPVQDRILEVIRRHLSPTGVGYVSYNTLPGWHQLAAIRDAMRFHGRSVSSPQDRTAAAREVVRALAGSTFHRETPFGDFVQAYDSFINHGMLVPGPDGDSLLLHNELAEENEPLYFLEFTRRASEHGLQYLSESTFSTVNPENLPPGDREFVLRSVDNVLDMEQYIDFFQNSFFRRTLLCHSELNVRRTLRPASLARLYVASPASASEGDDGLRRYVAADGPVLETDRPVLQYVMDYLVGAWPRRVAFGDLVRLCIRAGADGDLPTEPELSSGQLASGMAAALLKAWSRAERLVTLHTWAPELTDATCERPKAPAWARLQALLALRASEEGGEAGIAIASGPVQVTNANHERVSLSPSQFHLLPLLDGTRPVAELRAAHDGASPATLDADLKSLAGHALLIS